MVKVVVEAVVKIVFAKVVVKVFVKVGCVRGISIVEDFISVEDFIFNATSLFKGLLGGY